MLEPRYTVRFLSQLLQLRDNTVRKRIEAGEFGRYFQGRSGLEVTLRGLQTWLRKQSDGQLSAVEPYFSVTFLAALSGRTRQQVIDRIEAGEFGPVLVLSGCREHRVPLSGLNAYDKNSGVGSAKAS